jgi:hypothetical protein
VSAFGDLVRAIGAAAVAGGVEAVKLTLREREALARERKSAIKREIVRLKRQLARINKELENDREDALDICEAEIDKWGTPGEAEDWKDSPECVELRMEIMDIADRLLPDEEGEEEGEEEEEDEDWDDGEVLEEED